MARRYVVMGKGIPRSVGFRRKRGAIKYARYFAKKGKRPVIYKRDSIQLQKRFFKRYDKFHEK